MQCAESFKSLRWEGKNKGEGFLALTRYSSQATFNFGASTTLVDATNLEADLPNNKPSHLSWDKESDILKLCYI